MFSNLIVLNLFQLPIVIAKYWSPLPIDLSISFFLRRKPHRFGFLPLPSPPFITENKYHRPTEPFVINF